MSSTETTYRVRVSPPPSSSRTELNIVAAVVAVGICLVILALLANTPARRAAHHPRPHTSLPAADAGTSARALGATRTNS
jgi:hypothetical protein